MSKLQEMKKNKQFRQEQFILTFSSESGKLVLEYLRDFLKISIVDLHNPYDVYFKLGRLNTIKMIDAYLNKNNKETYNDR